MTNTSSNEPEFLMTDAEMKQQAKVHQAALHTDCFASAAMTMSRLHGNFDIVTGMNALVNSADKINDGNLNEIEQMLMTQAKALDFFFYQMLGKLADTHNVKQIQAYTDIALRSQNQSRKALSVLADFKNPRRATFIKQQNNAINQQVNNGAKPAAIKNKKKFANELIAKAPNGSETMDIGTTIEAIPKNTTTEAVGAINGAKNRLRQDDQ